MNNDTSDNLVTDYLNRLRSAARHLPRAQRDDLLRQIEEHVRDALAAAEGGVTTRTVLERLGDPQEIVAEQRERLGLPLRRVGGSEWVVIVLLLIGGFLAGVGWFVGVWLLWVSRAWSVSEKLVGTLVVPGGLFTAVALAAELTLTSGKPPPTLRIVLTAALAAVLLLAPICSAVFLARRAKASPA